MVSFQVEPDELDGLAGRVTVLQHDLASRGPAALPDRVRVPRLDDALEDFEHHWSDGMAIIRNQLEVCAARLHEAAAVYRAADACVAEATAPDPVIIP